jgi:hypothetical protein
MKTGRPIGDNMTRICAVVETAGPIAPIDIAGLVGMPQNRVRSYVCRATHRGMLVREGRKYTAVGNWRAVAGQAEPVVVAHPMPANSVFQMGDRAMSLVETHRRVTM